MNIADRRREYARASLDESAVARELLAQFAKWFDEALPLELPEPTAMALATVGPDAQPSVRMVLLKGYDAHGFVFFTNYESRKGRELAANLRAALLFFWPELERQIRIEGGLDKVSAAESDEYFRTRPCKRAASARGPRHRARSSARRRSWSASRRWACATARPTRPPHWGGYRVAPDGFEFWQGRPNRLHDRSAIATGPAGAWIIERLAP